MEYLKATPSGILKGQQPFVLRGMGLGSWLLPEGYMWKFYTKCDRPRRIEALIADLCGEDYAEAFWHKYYNNYITEQDIAWMAHQGLNSVRIPFNARHLFCVSEDGRVVFNDETIKRIDDCVTWCKKYGLYVFLDMHGAPGGQTGENIDDSEADIPALFCEIYHQKVLLSMWILLAERYKEEPAIGGYDLLNEPLPKWHSQYNHLLLPLYRDLIKVIRNVDTKHIIVLEGLHWSTDFSVFDEFTREEAADNILLEFHKYWNNPDQESLAPFLATAHRLQVPLWMGEGGENNTEWYTTVFPLYENLNIGWCFWSYKKMDGYNSPASFAMPEGWEEVINYLDGAPRPSRQRAKELFDAFLWEISNSTYHVDVVNALLRRPTLSIPAYAYDVERIQGIPQTRNTGDFRANSNATLRFLDGHSGEVDWKRYGGEPQPESERIALVLNKGDLVGYRISAQQNTWLKVSVKATGDGNLTLQGISTPVHNQWDFKVLGSEIVWLGCSRGNVWVESIHVEEVSGFECK